MGKSNSTGICRFGTPDSVECTSAEFYVCVHIMYFAWSRCKLGSNSILL